MIAQRAPTPVGSRDIHPCWHSHPARGPMVRARSARQGLIAGLLIGPCGPNRRPAGSDCRGSSSGRAGPNHEFIIAAGSDNSGQPESTPGAVPSSPRKEMLGSAGTGTPRSNTACSAADHSTTTTVNAVNPAPPRPQLRRSIQRDPTTPKPHDPHRTRPPKRSSRCPRWPPELSQALFLVGARAGVGWLAGCEVPVRAASYSAWTPVA